MRGHDVEAENGQYLYNMKANLLFLWLLPLLGKVMEIRKMVAAGDQIYFSRIGRKWEQNYQSHLSNPPGERKKKTQKTNRNKQKTKQNTTTFDREVLTDPSMRLLPRSFYMAILFCQELYEVSYFPAMSEETRKDHLGHWTVSRTDKAEVMVGREFGALSMAVLQSNVWITWGGEENWESRLQTHKSPSASESCCAHFFRGPWLNHISSGLLRQKEMYHSYIYLLLQIVPLPHVLASRTKLIQVSRTAVAAMSWKKQSNKMEGAWVPMSPLEKSCLVIQNFDHSRNNNRFWKYVNLYSCVSLCNSHY